MNSIDFYARKRSAPGTKISHATVTVYYPPGQTVTKATIFSDSNYPPTPKGNPFQTDDRGEGFFFAVDGAYDVQISGGTPSVDATYSTRYTLGDQAVMDVIPDGTTNLLSRIQSALYTMSDRGGGAVRLPSQGTYYLGAAALGLVVPGNVSFNGTGRDCLLTYDGNGSAVTFDSPSFMSYGNLLIGTTHLDANGVTIGPDALYSTFMSLNCFTTKGGLGTGQGVNFDNRNGIASNNSGWLTLTSCDMAGYKYGYRFNSANFQARTWTEVNFQTCTATGRFGSPQAGSCGVYFDDLTDGAGTVAMGGSIESFDYGIYVAAAVNAHGGTFIMGFEGNNHISFFDPRYFDGQIQPLYGGGQIDNVRSKGAGLPWWWNQWVGGSPQTFESYYAPRWVVYDDSGQPNEIVFYHGDSINAGGSPNRGFAFTVKDFNAGAPQNTYVDVSGQKLMWGSGPPVAGTHTRGSVVLNSNMASGQPQGWGCTAAGTPGTWEALPNLA